MSANRMTGNMNVPQKSKRGIIGLIKELFIYSKKLKVPMVIALCLAVGGAVLTIIGPNQLSRITDLISDGLFTGIDLAAIGRIGLMLLGLYLFSALFTYIEHYIMATITLNLSKELRRDLSYKINHVPMKCFGELFSRRYFLSRVTNDVSTLQQALSNSLPSIVSAAAQFIGCLIMMFATEWRMALAAVVATLLGFGIMAVIMSKSQGYFIARQQNLGRLNGYVEEMYSGHDVVRISRANRKIKHAFDGMNKAVYDADRKASFIRRYAAADERYRQFGLCCGVRAGSGACAERSDFLRSYNGIYNVCASVYLST